jgi:4-oxalocrotonate tautomerase
LLPRKLHATGKSGFRMPFIIVEMWQGRTVVQKSQLAEDITAAFVKAGVPADQVHIVFKDNPKHNWADGGKLADES